MTSELNQADYDQYDRQIHVWGAENQQRIMKSNVLFVNCDYLSCEVSKNVVLAGMNATLCDDAVVQDNEWKECFFLRKDDAGKNRAECVRERLQELNPRATLKSIQQCPPEEFSQYSLVVMSNPTLSSLSSVCSLSMNIPVFAIFGDGPYTYILNLTQMGSKLPTYLTMTTDEVKAIYRDSSFWRLLSHLSQPLVHTPVAIAAVAGGFMTKFVVGCLTGNEKLETVFEFDGFAMNGTVFNY